MGYFFFPFLKNKYFTIYCWRINQNEYKLSQIIEKNEFILQKIIKLCQVKHYKYIKKKNAIYPKRNLKLRILNFHMVGQMNKQN